MPEKSALDYAAEMFKYVIQCECGRNHSVSARAVRPNLRVTCRNCHSPTFINEAEATRFNVELNDSLRLVAQQLGLHFEPISMPKQRANASLKPRQAKGYPVGLVGESFYQATVERCHIGEKVKLLREVGNPHDPRAIAVENESGQTLGYIPRDSFLQRLIHDEKGGCSASILKVNRGGPSSALVGITIDVVIDDQPIGTRHFIQA